MTPEEAMTKSLAPILFILGGIAIIVFNRYIASGTIRTYRMMRIPLLFPEKDMHYYWIAIGVFTIVVGTLFLLSTLRL